VTERLPAPDTTKLPVLDGGDVRVLDRGQLIGRIHAQAGSRPSRWDEFRAFGPTTSRFDHQPPPRRVHPSRAVLYGAPALPGLAGPVTPVLATCLAECFRDRGVIELSRDSPYFAVFRTARAVRLLDLADTTWVTRAGGNAAISSGLRSVARQWARTIYRHYTGADAVDGLIDTCSNIPSARSLVLWERARDAVPARPLVHRPLADPSLRAELEVYATDLGLGLAP
jgi:hypothetical protein